MKKFDIVNDRKLFTDRLKGLIKDYKKLYNVTDEYIFKEILCVGKTTYYDWFKETKSTYPSFENIIKLANLFNVSTDYLMCLSDDKSPQHKELNFNIKQISEKTGLSENVTTQLYSKNPYFEIMPKFINYFFETSDTLIKLLKTYSVTDWTKKSSDELQAVLDEILNVMIEENESKKDNKRIYASKRLFLRYMFFYVFEKVSKIAYSDEKHKLKTIDREVILLNEFSQENGIIGNNYTIDAQLFDKFYLDTSLKYLSQIKDHFEKYDYEKTHNRRGIIPKK